MDAALCHLVTKEILQFYDTRSPERVGVSASYDDLRAYVHDDFPEHGESPEDALQKLISSVEHALIHSVNPRYYGFVIGGAMPVSIAADWLTSAWDQNAQVYQSSPAAAMIEEVVRTWMLDLLDLPTHAGIGYVTGAQMANFVGLTVARNAVLHQHGWDVDAKGLQQAPHLSVMCGECCHGTITSAIRLMGFGTENIVMIPADPEGRMYVPDLRRLLRQHQGPAILCLQAGNVNTGAFDPFEEIIAEAHAQNIWVHVDGAFGLWARATPSLKHLTQGIQHADSWSVDAHKWLNVPYDSGIVIVRDPAHHQRLKTTRCAYAGEQADDRRDGSSWVPENSRRARAFVLYAALRTLGREGVAHLIRHSCDLAKRFADGLSAIPGVRVINEVVLNQIVFRLEPPHVTDLETFHHAVAARLQRSGLCWIGTTVWKGQMALRISISNYVTQEHDVTIALECLVTAMHEEVQQQRC